MMAQPFHSSDKGNVAFVTIVTRSYLAQARVLAASLAKHHAIPLYVVCVDEPQGYFDPVAEPFHVLRLEQILPEAARPALFYYTPFEVCNLVRPFLHRYLLEHTSFDRWLYLDADILVRGPLDDAFAAMDDATGLLSPHTIEPAAPEVAEVVEASLTRCGVFNSGVLGLRRCDEAARFVDWFAERLVRLCFLAERNVYVDQTWLNFVPIYFPSFAVWKHPGHNVAYWNLHERVLETDGDRITVNGEPLLFFHFSLWKPEKPDNITIGWPMAAATNPLILQRLATDYRALLLEAGHEQCRAWPYGFATFRNGQPISKAMRRHYYDLVMSEKAPAGSPFDHPEWFRHIARRIEWRRYVPQFIKNAVRRAAV